MLERLVRADEKERRGKGWGARRWTTKRRENESRRKKKRKWRGEGWKGKGWEDRNTSEGEEVEEGKSFDRKANGGKKGKLH